MIRAKLVLRNVIGKPLRSAIIILSLAAAAFAALFCIAGIHAAQYGLRDFFRSNYGDADIIISNSNKVEVKKDEFPSGSKILETAVGAISQTVPNTKYFNYVDKMQLSVIGMDTQLAAEMNMIDDAYPTGDGVTMSEPAAKLLDKKVGDTYTFAGEGDRVFSYKINAIVPATKFLNSSQNCIIVTPDICNEIMGADKGTVNVAYADVPDEQLEDCMFSIQDKHPDHYIIATVSWDNDDTMSSMLNIYYLIFAVVFLMVCFIIVSMSKHIVNERMSVIGMLRSIGGSITGTGMILLAESAFYGLCGGILGTLLFLPFKGNAEVGLFAASGDIDRSDGVDLPTILIIIVAVIVIQCLFSAIAIIKAAKTPVRDIIFGTKDTAYLPSKVFSVIGLVLFAVGIIAFFLFDDFIMIVTAAFCSAIGAVLIFPMVIKLISKVLSELFGKFSMPVAKLAVKEIATTKSNVSSAQLILSAISLTISVLIVAVSLINMLASPVYNSEIIITDAEQEGAQYDLIKSIDGVQDVEKIYSSYLIYENKAEFNGEERDIELVGYPEGGFSYFTGIKDCPEKLSDNETAIDKVLASRLSLKIGDEVTIGLNTKTYYPRELKLKIVSFVDGGQHNSMGNTVLINLDTYKNVYFDSPSTVLIRTSPEKIAYVLDVVKSTIPDYSTNIRTTEEYNAEMLSSMNSILTIIYAIVLLGFALSLMGTSSNILMGFEQSRRKYAVYYSSSMSKSKLKKLILLETMLTNGISVVAAIVFGMYFLQIINKALTMLNMSVPLINPLLYALIFGAAAFAILTIAAVKPVRMLSKMNIAEEIKTSAD